MSFWQIKIFFAKHTLKSLETVVLLLDKFLSSNTALGERKTVIIIHTGILFVYSSYLCEKKIFLKKMWFLSRTYFVIIA